MPNIVAVIFAHNEQFHLGVAIDEIRNAGKINHIIVVDDGSTDGTAKVAEDNKVILIRRKKNLGKREAFISGAIKARELGAEVLLTLDADITKFPHRTFEEMVREVTVGKKLMAVAAQHEAFALDDWHRGRVIDPHSNAQRAINMKALDPLFRGDEKWVSALTEKKRKWHSGKYFLKEMQEGYKWALEYSLDKLIPQNKVSFSVGDIVTLQPYRTGNKSIRGQLYAREIVKDQLKNRSGKAKSLMSVAKKNPLVWKALRKKWLAKKAQTKALNKIKIMR
jgi:glycosyltransferase involved in cell wall biosynthesis